MGPRPCSRGNRARVVRHAAPLLASMGPRPCSRGNPPAGPSAWARSGRFNGATALQPWKHSSRPFSMGPDGTLQWGHGLAAVETQRDRVAGVEGHHASMGPRPCSRGNFAALGELRDQFAASMGPRPCSRGNRYWIVDAGVWGRLQWGHGLAAVETGSSVTSITFCRELQWGHGLAAVETRIRGGEDGDARVGFNGATALQPWKRPILPSARTGRACFNGATALQPWKPRGES